MTVETSETLEQYKVVVNHEEQYSIWLANRDLPLGWNEAGKKGTKEECLAYIDKVWVDMRPLSLRRFMEEAEQMESNASAGSSATDGGASSHEDDLVSRLSAREQAVQLVLLPEKNVQTLKSDIERGYVHVKFTETKGGTELGIKLDEEACCFNDVDTPDGHIHLEGNLTLNYEQVRCTADIHTQSMEGKGRLNRLTSQ